MEGKSQKYDTKMHIIIASGLLAFFIFLFILSYLLGGIAGQVPLLISGAGITLSVIELFSLTKHLRSQTTGGKPPEPPAGMKWYYSVVILITYITILMLFGFLASTLLYLFICPAILGYKKWHVNAIFSITATVILYLSFVKLFMVRLPIGIIIANLLGR